MNCFNSILSFFFMVFLDLFHQETTKRKRSTSTVGYRGSFVGMLKVFGLDSFDPRWSARNEVTRWLCGTNHGPIRASFPETNSSVPENWWLEDYFHYWFSAYVQGRVVSFREGNELCMDMLCSNDLRLMCHRCYNPRWRLAVSIMQRQFRCMIPSAT